MDQCSELDSHLRSSGLTPGQSTKTLSATRLRRKGKERKKERNRERERKKERKEGRKKK